MTWTAMGCADVAWNHGDDSTCVRARDGSRIGSWPSASIMPGQAGYDGDGRADLLLVHNAQAHLGPPGPTGLWHQHRVEIVSGASLTVVRTFDVDSMGLSR